MYYTVTKHSGHLRTLEKCRKHSPAARVVYISLVFSNACRRVLSQYNTRLRASLFVNYDIVRALNLTVFKNRSDFKSRLAYLLSKSAPILEMVKRKYETTPRTCNSLKTYKRIKHKAFPSVLDRYSILFSGLMGRQAGAQVINHCFPPPLP